MSDYLVTGTELTGIADAIRTAGGTSASLSFPSGFTSAIAALSGGGSSSVTTAEWNSSPFLIYEADTPDCYYVESFSEFTISAVSIMISSITFDFFAFWADETQAFFGAYDDQSHGWMVAKLVRSSEEDGLVIDTIKDASGNTLSGAFDGPLTVYSVSLS